MYHDSPTIFGILIMGDHIEMYGQDFNLVTDYFNIVLILLLNYQSARISQIILILGRLSYHEKVTPRSETETGLGDRGDVPAAVHQRMEQLFQAGGVPKSTPQQRKRQRGTGGSQYVVPQGPLVEALEWGYISPNLPAPAGLRWVGQGNKWALCVHGG